MTLQPLKTRPLKGSQNHNSSPYCRLAVSQSYENQRVELNESLPSSGLDNPLLNVHHSPFRELRWRVMDFQRTYSPNKGQALCGLRPIQKAERFKVGIEKVKGQSAKYTNRMLFKSFWCPYCSEVFRAEKRDKIQRGLNYALRSNKKIYFITWTIPKAYGSTEDKFKALNGVIRGLWNRLRNKTRRENNGFYFIKGLDLTVNDKNPNPLHLHTHSLVILDREIPDLDKWLWSRYAKLMDKLNCGVSELAYDFQEVNCDKQLDKYITKNWSNLDKELTSTNKMSKSTESLGWFRWLCKIQENPTHRQISIYQTFLEAAKGKRTLDLSRNFNELLKDTDKDQELDNLEGSQDGDTPLLTLDIGKNLWEAIIRSKSEFIILGVIDSFYDCGTHNKEFEFIIGLIEASNASSYTDKVKINNFIESLRHLRYNLLRM